MPCPLTVAPSCGIWAAQASPPKTWIQRQERERPEWGYALQQLRVCSSLLSLGPDLCAHRALWPGSGGESACSSVSACVPEARDRVCMCRMWVCVYMACVCRTIYTHAACMQGCLHVCKCTCVCRTPCVSAHVCIYEYARAHICKDTSVILV